MTGDAANQQERLSEFRGWVIGFVDGEGCFSIGLVRQPNRANRSGYKTGYQVSHDFVVTHHLTHAGLAEIVEVMQTMNRKKPRHELIRILRDHTPDVRDTG